MANEEHLERIKEGALVWNTWRESSDERPDLRDAHLRSANLSGAHLSGADVRIADLRGADLSDANLSDADLSGADLSDTDLRETDLRGSVLKGADLSYANMVGSNLSGADLTHASLSGAYLRRAHLYDANLSGTHIGYTTFTNVDISATKGLAECEHIGPSAVDHLTLEQSGDLPEIFLRGCGFSDVLIDYIPTLFGAGGIEFFSCFISYSSDDKAFAKRLYDALQGRGIRCWLDEKQILPGDDIHDEIDRGIRMWDKVLLCASQNSLKSWWVDSEIDKVLEKERKLMKEREKKILSLIPLNLDGYLFDEDGWQSGMKSQVTRRIAADFTDWKTDHDKFEDALDKVVQALRADGGQKEAPPPGKL